MSSWKKRISLHGDIPLRIVRTTAPMVPYYLEPFFLALYTTLIWLFGAAPRRQIKNNLDHLLGKSIFNWLRCWVVFWSFAQGINDVVCVRQEGRDFCWEAEGAENFEQMGREPGGAIILTAHMGNYDLAASFFVSRLGRVVHAVRAPEAVAQQREQLEESREDLSHDLFQFHYNENNNLLGLDLLQFIQKGEIVALQGDRVFGEISPLVVPVGEHAYAVPKGPFALSLATGCPLYPLFIARTGWRRYRVIIGKSFFVERGGKSKEEALFQAARIWAEHLYPVLRRHWRDWFVFENPWQGVKE